MEAKKAKKNKVRGIKNAFIVIIICFIVALVVFTQVLGAPENFEGGDPAGGHPLNLLGTIYKGGFIVPILQTLLLTVIVLSVERFIAMLSVKGKGNTNKFIAAVKAALEKGDMPSMQQNLPIVATMTTLGTLVGLLGTVLGMIKSFQALATAGAPDSVALSTGISEALVNTAFGIATGALAVISYNYFSNKIDNVTYAIDEVGFCIVNTFAATHK